MESQKANTQLLDTLKQQLDQLQALCNQVAQAQDAQRLQLIQLAGVVQQTHVILQQIAITELRGQPQYQQWPQMLGFGQGQFPQAPGFPPGYQQGFGGQQPFGGGIGYGQQPPLDPALVAAVRQVVQQLQRPQA